MTPHTTLGLALLFGLAAPAGQDNPPSSSPSSSTARSVDLVICLDTSGSMSGLIDAARQNIWSVVNDLALARPTPKLRLALLTFGNQGHKPEDGWVNVDTGFTEDLDLVSEKLFALATDGGEEYVGRVLQASLDQLAWSKEPGALRMIVVAGNEAADQDPKVDFRSMSSRAIAQDIIVNSIYCGNPGDELAPVWREVATRADGQFAAIDQNNGTIVIETPFDKEITTLSAALNATYLPYGKEGQKGQLNQVLQDENAVGLNTDAAAQRAVTKCGAAYACAWDLVDMIDQKKIALEDVKVEDLPAAMHAMSLEARSAHVQEMKEKRIAIKKTVGEIDAKRRAHVAGEMKKRALDPSRSFDFAVRRAVRAQAEAKGFRYAEPEAPVAGESVGK